MKILLSNDDGYRAEGLRALHEALEPLAELTVVAPDRNRSGASNSLTLDVPLRVMPFGERKYLVANGTPTDCVHLAISGLFENEPEHDMVVSGINDGANLGDDVLYSGTVAAAIEGRFLGLPAIAVSLVIQPHSGANSRNHFVTAARVAAELVMRVQRTPLHQATILNVNVPDVPYETLKGYQATRLGFRHRSERIVRMEDPRGRPVYWVGPSGGEQDAGPGTDFHAVANNYVSVTPLQIDLTRHTMLDDMRAWLQGREE
jgi:5'-nucleotidase